MVVRTTKLFEVDFDSGPFGGTSKRSNLLLDVHTLRSDGYQTYDYLNRWGGGPMDACCKCALGCSAVPVESTQQPEWRRFLVDHRN